MRAIKSKPKSWRPADRHWRTAPKPAPPTGFRLLVPESSMDDVCELDRQRVVFDRHFDGIEDLRKFNSAEAQRQLELYGQTNVVVTITGKPPCEGCGSNEHGSFRTGEHEVVCGGGITIAGPLPVTLEGEVVDGDVRAGLQRSEPHPFGDMGHFLRLAFAPRKR